MWSSQPKPPIRLAFVTPLSLTVRVRILGWTVATVGVTLRPEWAD